MSTEIGIAFPFLKQNQRTVLVDNASSNWVGPIFLASAVPLHTFLRRDVLYSSLLQKHDLPASDLARFT